MKYVIGIDLGTTNTELAYCSLEDDTFQPRSFEIPQFVAPSTIESRLTLPSCLYIGAEEERSFNDWKLPWDSLDDLASELNDDVSTEKGPQKPNAKSEKKGFFKKIFGLNSNDKGASNSNKGVTDPNALYLVGEIANRRMSETPEKVVSSAKSWLTCAKLDRRSPILPWNTPNAVSKVSPVEASRHYLAHLVSAWNAQFPDDPIFDQQVVITVPASFDESARELTREAAIEAGFAPSTLLFLEEPQAALYAWLAQNGDSWRKKLAAGDVILVCDVGGGTTDLSLIQVKDENGDLVLDRLAVGKRLLLGGDNLDLALAYRASELFAAQGSQLDPWQSNALQKQCRTAKEALLSSSTNSPDGECYKITVLGRSSSLVGGSVSVNFPKQDAVQIALDGFFPLCSLDDRPQKRSGLGLREKGLPYETDPAITRHVASFLSSCHDESGNAVVPTCFLLNGGVFKSELLAKRFSEQLEHWYPETKPTDLDQEADLEGAVSHGAAYYGAMKIKGGIRIRGASARSYYIGIESTGLAIPGVARPLKALCVAPVGMEEGTKLDVPSDVFELVVGELATFRFFSSTTRPQDRPGATINWFESSPTDDLQETDPIVTILEDVSPSSDDKVDEGNTGDAFVDPEPEYVSVRFHSVVTELGALEIWCEEIDGTRRWKLEFNVRED